MPDKKRLNVNDAPKWFKILLVLFPLVGIALVNVGFHNDLYFLYPTGEYIVNNGIPHSDILSMHSNMHIVVQQWLSSVVFYFVYSRFGTLGVSVMTYICYIALVLLVNKLCRTITDNFGIACIFTFVICLIMSAMFIAARPQIFTYLLVLFEILCLENFVKTKKTYLLFFIPLISLALINLHAAMWGMMFVFAMPYAAAALPIKAGKIKQEPCCSFVKLLICGIVSFAVGFCNPYGWESMSYILTSFGLSAINNRVYEMNPVSFSDGAGVITITLVAVLLVLAIIRKDKAFTTRFVLMFAGTLILALLNIKSIAYFLIAGVPAYSYMMKSAKIEIPLPDNTKSTGSNKKRIVLLCTLIVALGALAGVLAMRQSDAPAENEAAPVKNTYEYMDDMVEILDKSDEEVVLFAGFDWGQYLEYKGYHPYIDGRAELFMKQNNKDFDYLTEYNHIISGTLYYKDFIDKYNFNYLIVSDREIYLRSALLRDDDYTVLVDSGEITLFKAK
ncbi:MAG: hypothetical protein IJI47_03295 [Eubacterium sp.]|nr:hypothetical protein [Eubacterium sp.]MBR0412573.1 hypothetical protein [Eubacterium sp.]